MADEGGPIIVCTRNDDLQSVLEATPPQRREGQSSQREANTSPGVSGRVLSTAQKAQMKISLSCADLVFIQNGMLEPWLAERGLADNTQARLPLTEHHIPY